MSKFGKKFWMDGSFVDLKDGNIPIMSHGIHYGSSFFEGIRAYETSSGAAIFRLDEHLKRLQNSLKAYRLDVPFTVDELKSTIIELIRINEFKHCYIRPFITLGVEWDGVFPKDDIHMYKMISTWQLPCSTEIKRTRLCVSSYRRTSQTMTPMQAKCASNYMNSLLMKKEAKKNGYDDAVALDVNGNLSESSVANIFLVFGKKLYTPSLDCSVLNGITRQTVIDLSTDLGYEVIERTIGRDELYYADEIFITGTANEITSVSEVDGIKIGSGEIPAGEAFFNAYSDIVTGKNKKYDYMLTYV